MEPRLNRIKIMKNNKQNVELPAQSVDDEVERVISTFEKLEEMLDQLSPEAQKKLGELMARAQNGGAPVEQGNADIPMPDGNTSKIISLSKRVISPELLEEGNLSEAPKRLKVLEERIKSMPRKELIDYIKTFVKYNGWQSSRKPVAYRYEDEKGEFHRFAFVFEDRLIKDSKGVIDYSFGVQNDWRTDDDWSIYYITSTLDFRSTDNPSNICLQRRRSLFNKNANKLNLQFANLLELILDNQGKVFID